MDREKLRQALIELAYTAGVAFVLPLLGYLAGLSQLPNLEAGEAALRAGTVAALVSLGKAGLWYLTGTKVERTTT